MTRGRDRRFRVGRPVLALLGALVVALTGAAPAAALVRFTTPGGATSGNCFSSSPCNLEFAVESAAGPGDEVIVGRGTYALTDTVTISDANLNVHGEEGFVTPVVSMASAGVPVIDIGAVSGVRLADLDIRQNSGGASLALRVLGGGTLDRLSLSDSSANADAVQLTGDTTLSNSAVRASASGDVALDLRAGTFSLVNDTILATNASSTGLQLLSTCPTCAVVATVRNSILDGLVDGSVQNIGGGPADNATLNIDHSDFDGITNSGGVVNQGAGNLSGAPLFVNSASGDLREAPGSPTIDAGIADPLGGRDFQREPRPNGLSADIGADEFYADAATRYADPDATAVGGCTTPASACRAERAVTAVAVAGDEVIVQPGHYDLQSTLQTGGDPIDLHGAAGQPRPVLTGTQSNPLVTVSLGGKARNLELRNDGSGEALHSLGNGQIDRVYATSSDPGADAIALAKGDVLTNSVAWARNGSGNAQAISATPNNGTTVVRNVTAISRGSGNSTGLLLIAAFNGRLVARNVIARGGSGGDDVRALAPTASDSATIEIGNSNYRTADLGGGSGTEAIDESPGGNQRAVDPLFADALHGDFHELAGSPTADAGVADPLNGALDVDGDPRTIGTLPDIGADELRVTPVVTTAAASAVGVDTATMNGTVDPEGQATAAYFEYGPTTAYGSRTADVSAGAATDPAAFSAAVAGLAPGTTFHYRAAAVNGTGTSFGVDMTFTTAAATVPGPAGGGGTGSGGSGGSGGGGGGGGATPLPDVLAPGVTSFTSTNKTFRRGTPAALRTAAAPRGTHFRFTLSEAANVAIVFEQRTSGRRAGSRCVKTTRKNAKSRKCTRYVRRGTTLNAPGIAGANAVPFTGAVGGKNLPLGSFRATIVATDAARNASKKRQLTFKIVRR